jgi:S1-C subfamily serine protease
MVKEINKGEIHMRKKIIYGAIFIFLISMCAYINTRYNTKVNKPYKLEIIKELIVPYQSSVRIYDKEDKFFGSGTIIYSKENFSLLILSARHVVDTLEGDIFISVPYDSIKRKAHILKEKNILDLVILKTDEKEKEARAYSKLSTTFPKIGEHVWSIGSPGGDDRVLSDGIISKMFSKTITFKDFIDEDIDDIGMDVEVFYYRVNAPFFLGSSGGGVFNSEGKLIGVMSFVGVASSNLNVVNEDETIEQVPGMFCTIPEPGAFFATPLESIRKIVFEE